MTAVLDAPIGASTSTTSAVLMGREEPRLWTRPLRELTPETSLGFQAIAFAETVLGLRLLPWQRWWLIHALELRPAGPDGQRRFRFRVILTLVGRQNGKTTLVKVLSLWAMYAGVAHLVLGVAQSLDIAREAWAGAVELTAATPALAAEVANVRRANGEQCLTLMSGARYRITAATRGAGRGLSVDLLALDELREQRTTEAWAALSKTTMARPNALTIGISNAGDDESIVLNTLRSAALGGADESLAIFEWSAPDDCALDDPQAWAQACPGLGITVTIEAIRTALASDTPAVFRTEVLCQHVRALDSAVDPTAWEHCEARTGPTLALVRDRVAVCVDVAPDGQHVTLAGAGVMPDGRIRVETLGAWSSTDAARRELPALLDAIAPAVVGRFPVGPGAVLGPDLPADTVSITGGDVVAACMSLADLTLTRRIAHPGDALLTAHISGAQKLPSGDGWRFTRAGGGHVDAAYAVAGAVQLARTLPPPAPPTGMLVI